MIDFPLLRNQHVQGLRINPLAVALFRVNAEQFIFGTLAHFQVLFMEPHFRKINLFFNNT